MPDDTYIYMIHAMVPFVYNDPELHKNMWLN